MKQQNFETGKLGEELAAKYLSDRGYQVINKNFKTKFGEIDLITTTNPSTGSGRALLVFVEVKLKIGEDFGTPEEMINSFKLSQVQNTAVAFLQSNPEIERQHNGYRIDAVCIVLDQNKEVLRINHYENLTF